MLKNMLSLVGFFFLQWLKEVAKIPIHYQHLCTKPCFAHVCHWPLSTFHCMAMRWCLLLLKPSACTFIVLCLAVWVCLIQGSENRISQWLAEDLCSNFCILRLTSGLPTKNGSRINRVWKILHYLSPEAMTWGQRHHNWATNIFPLNS